QHFERHPDQNMADVAYTLQVGRRAFSHRRVLTCRDRDEAVFALHARDPNRVFTATQEARNAGIVFMFSGHGGQHVNMALEHYRTESTFREQLDLCAELLNSDLHIDLREVLYPRQERIEQATQKLNKPAFTLPALFAIEYSLAKQWMKWGIRPVAMIGYSL